MNARMQRAFAVATCLLSAISMSCSHPEAEAAKAWDAKAAAAYLDSREGWWMTWTRASRDHGTFCVSCHTVLPYALSRPALRLELAEEGPSVNERKLIDNVTQRVRLWRNLGPYYSDTEYDHKTAESRGTESVLNALILANYDSQGGGYLSEDTRSAFANMWELQQTTGEEKGSWLWLQFDVEPWEADDSAYYGATLAAMAVGIAPESYKSSPNIQGNLALLRDYLKRESAAQSTLNRVFLLWASTRLPGLLTPEQQKAIIHEIMARQQADGGWRLASIAWRWNSWRFRSFVNMWFREDGTPLAGKSDGVATGLVTLVLRGAGVAPENAQLRRGLSWLESNQNAAGGFWPAASLNKKRSPTSDTGRFMSDAATAYAVLALTENQRTKGPAAAAITADRHSLK